MQRETENEQAIDEAALVHFTGAMRTKLAQARDKGRGGWHDPAVCTPEFLADLLVGHLAKSNAGNFLDIAILAMMLHQRGADPAIMAPAVARNTENLLPWRPIAKAVKGGPAIWAKMREDLSILADRPDLEIWNGVEVPLHHPGTYQDADGRLWDHGWNIAASVGHGGFPDQWIAGWVPLRSHMGGWPPDDVVLMR